MDGRYPRHVPSVYLILLNEIKRIRFTSYRTTKPRSVTFSDYRIRVTESPEQRLRLSCLATSFAIGHRLREASNRVPVPNVGLE